MTEGLLIKTPKYPIVYIKESEVYGMVLYDDYNIYRVAYPAYKDGTGWCVVVNKELDSEDSRIECHIASFYEHELEFTVK